MKAIIVTVLTPDDWTKSDVITAFNIGIKAYAEKQGFKLNAIDYNAHAIAELNLRDRDAS